MTTAVAVPLSTLVPMKQVFLSSVGKLALTGFRLAEFLDRERLAGKTALAHEQVFQRQQPHIAGNHVAGGELDDVPRHKIAQRQFACRTVAKHCRGNVNHGLELLGGGVRPGFLKEAQSYAQAHHQCHHVTGARIAGNKGHRRQG